MHAKGLSSLSPLSRNSRRGIGNNDLLKEGGGHGRDTEEGEKGGKDVQSW